MELALAYELEHDPNVLEYFDQPHSLKLVYKNAKTKHLAFFILPIFLFFQQMGYVLSNAKPEKNSNGWPATVRTVTQNRRKGFGSVLQGKRRPPHTESAIRSGPLGKRIGTTWTTSGFWKTISTPIARTRARRRKTISMLRSVISTRLPAPESVNPCGFFHDAVRFLERAFPESGWPTALMDAVSDAKERLTEHRYDCLGCEVCYPASALNAVNEEGRGEFSGTCPTELQASEEGWPPLPGDYRILRYRAPVAVCTLGNARLSDSLAKREEPGLSIVGTLHTENLGLERIVANIVSNPNLRFLIICGPDARQKVGHLAGQALLSLGEAGLDAKGRIIGALGKRPVIRNVAREVVDHFRKNVTLIDMRDMGDEERILARVRDCASRNPGMSDPFPAIRPVETFRGELPSRMIPDPAGYFVVYPDPFRKKLLVEHYQNDGILDGIIEEKRPPKSSQRQSAGDGFPGWTMPPIWSRNWPGQKSPSLPVSPISRIGRPKPGHPPDPG